MALDYTAKQRKAINKAFSSLCYLAGMYSQLHRISAAYRMERSQRGSGIAAKALIVQCAAAPPSSLVVLSSYADGCAIAAIAGARIESDSRGYEGFGNWAEFQILATASNQAHTESITNRLDELKAS